MSDESNVGGPAATPEVIAHLHRDLIVMVSRLDEGIDELQRSASPAHQHVIGDLKGIAQTIRLAVGRLHPDGPR
jgi:hypothetical protein